MCKFSTLPYPPNVCYQGSTKQSAKINYYLLIYSAKKTLLGTPGSETNIQNTCRFIQLPVVSCHQQSHLAHKFCRVAQHTKRAIIGELIKSHRTPGKSTCIARPVNRYDFSKKNYNRTQSNVKWQHHFISRWNVCVDANAFYVRSSTLYLNMILHF